MHAESVVLAEDFREDDDALRRGAQLSRRRRGFVKSPQDRHDLAVETLGLGHGRRSPERGGARQQNQGERGTKYVRHGGAYVRHRADLARWTRRSQRCEETTLTVGRMDRYLAG